MSQMVRVFVGMDYHDRSVQVCVMDESGRVLMNRQLPNNWPFIDRCVRCHGERIEAAIECCTGAADLADTLVHRAGWLVSLAHPGYVHRIKQSPDKSDFSDARLLADLMRVGYLPRVWLAPPWIRELRRLVRYRQQLVEQRRATKLRVSALLREHRRRWTAGRTWTRGWRHWLAEDVVLPETSRWILEQHFIQHDHLQEQIQLTEKRLAAFVKDDPLVARLCEQPGVALVTACVLRAEIGDFNRFRSGKQLSRFCGLSPRNASSGERQADAGLIKAGSPYLRATIVETAHRLMRLDPRWQDFTLRLLEKGKPKSVIGAAVANRWTRWLLYRMQEVMIAA